MRIEYEGEPYEFEMADISIKQGIKIEKHLGCPISEFGERLYPSDDSSPDLLALQCLGWLILHGGKGIPIEDTDFKVKALTKAVTDAVAAAQAAEQTTTEAAAARPVPTGAADPSVNGTGAMAEPLTVP